MRSNTNNPTPVDDSVEVRHLDHSRWYELRNPVRIVANLYLFELAKYLPNTPKNAIYRAAGVDIGDGSVLAPQVQVDPFFPDSISIGENSVVGWDTKLLTHEAYVDEWHVGSLEIGDDVTLGHSSSTRPGVTIGDGATVAAHSFVNRDVDPGETVGGIPIERL
ncbi:MAG: DapH/DapD/GlmU-related protein [Halodesulfurarchaeum sp.]